MIYLNRHLASLVLAYLFFVPFSHAQVLLGDPTITQAVWKQAFGVSDAQLSSSTWLAADDDGDGVKNGDELSAGTNPFPKKASDVHFKVLTVGVGPSTVALTFPTVIGKYYTVEGKSALTNASWVPTNVNVIGDGNLQTLVVPKSGGNYFHVVVQDQATQGDQVSDWAKHILGFSTSSPISAQSHMDHNSLANALTTQQNVVTLAATTASTTAPPDAATIATGLGVVTVSRGGYYLFSQITVGLGVSGTAVKGSDYVALPTSITLPAGVKSLDLRVTPVFNAARLNPTSLVVTAQPGGGYVVGSPSSAALTIYPTQTPAGTGLTGTYYVGSSPTYAGPENFGGATVAYSYVKGATTGTATISYSGTPAYAVNNQVNLKFTTGNLSGGLYDRVYSVATASTSTFTVTITGASLPASDSNKSCILNPPLKTQVDSLVDFVWGTVTTPIINTGAYTVRWTGQVQPQYTEPYYFDVRSDDGARLWVNGVLVIDNWKAQGVLDQYGSINLQAGILYDIKLEYLQVSGSAEVHLSWYSADQVKQIIPTNRLYPNATGSNIAAPPAITSAPAVVAFLNHPYPVATPLFSVTASNGPNTFALTPASGQLPNGLTLSSTGAISGTPSVAGDFPVAVQATNSTGIGSAALDIQVLSTGNAITRELYNGFSGKNVSDLQALIALNTAPSSIDTSLSTLEDATTTSGASNSNGERLRGYITVPASGNYYFYLAGSGDANATQNVAELWISNNSEPVNKVRRAFIAGANGTTAHNYFDNNQPHQKSGWLSLLGGQKYYFEVLHNLGSGGAVGNLSVAWVADPTGSSTYTAASNLPIVPGYVLSPWDNPATTAVSGSLYVTDLSSLPGVATSATGSAFLRLTPATSSAVVHINNPAPLASGIVSRAIYSGTLQSPVLLFDLDAQDKLYPDLKTNDAGYTWSGISGSALSTLTSGGAFLMVKTTANPTGEVYGTLGLTSGSQTPPTVPTYPAWSDDHATDAPASRFLTQATFGPSPSDMSGANGVKNIGYNAWLNNQFALSASYHTPLVTANLSADPTQGYPSTLEFNAWWQQSVTAPDQLRQRIAFALSEIMVISDVGPLNNEARWLSNYYDVLLANCFKDFRTLLKSVTLSPAMGVYLDMRANSKGNLATGLHANENYAREIQQLFSIGLYRRWSDGTLALDSTGNPVPTYTQSGITGFAQVLTGWNYNQTGVNGRLPTNFNPSRDYVNPMTLIPLNHELGSKLGLDNVVFPAANTALPPASVPYTPITLQAGVAGGPTAAVGSQADTNAGGTAAPNNPFDNYCSQELETLLDQILANSSVGPYICRQLIQRLVTSNPKPEYVSRVTRAFNGEQYVDAAGQPLPGDGVKGKLTEVIRAILLDSEARSSTAKLDYGFGKQREPLLRLTAPARALPAAALNATYRQLGEQPILITTTTPHRLISGDTVFLDKAVDGGGVGGIVPTAQSYSVANATPTYVYVHTGPSTGTVTVNAPGFAVGDLVPVQFTSGSLSTFYNSVQDLTVASTTPSGANGGSFTANLTSITAADQLSTANAVTPDSFTVNAGSLVTPTYDNTTSGNAQIVTIAAGTSAWYIAGAKIYVKFGSGGLATGAFDGTYTIASATANSCTIQLASIPSTGLSGNCIIPRLNAGYVVTTVGSTSTITISTQGSHYLNGGDSVQLEFVSPPPSGNVAIIAPSTVYSVASVIDSDHFTVTTSPAVTNTSQNTSGVVVYPLTPPTYYTRNGTLAIEQGTWNISYTDSDVTQTPIEAATVFNYYYPDYQYPGAIAQAGLTTPEFQGTNDTNVMTLTNTLTGLLVPGSGNPNGFINYKGGAMVLDLSPYMTAAQTSDGAIPALVDTLGNLLTGGNLQTNATTAVSNKSVISNYVTGFLNGVSGTQNFPMSSPPTNSQMRDRVRAIVHLLLVSPDFAIQK